MTGLGIVFLVGLAGSLHCAGMCGGFVVAIAQMDRSGHPVVRQLAYHAGKTTTYAVLGALSGAAGAAVGRAFAGLQNAVAIVLGVVLVCLGLWLIGRLPFLRMVAVPFADPLSRALGRLVSSGSTLAVFALGLLNGLLPCGLVYAMLAVAAATGTVVGGMLTMTVFGLATVPALVALSVSVRFARPLWRTRLNHLAGAMVIVLGIVTLFRGLPFAQHLLHSQHAPTETVHESGAAPHHH